MKCVLERDKKRRNLYKKYEMRRIVLKSLLCNNSLKGYEKDFVRYLLQKVPRNSSLTRISNRCTLTGRRRGVIRRFRLSRIMLKKYSLLGWIPGMRKV